jgi:hypothetical protein
MKSIDSRVAAWLTWALPFAVLALLIGWETEWGHALKRVPAQNVNVAPQPVNVALLPEYQISGGVAERRDTVERTLFNPTRRPAPPPPSAGAKSAIQPGQFVLTGTTVVDQKATAFLREVNGGRSRRVQQGESINGMLVAEVRPDRVKLTQGGDAEILTLKVALGPKTTIQPVAAPQPGAPAQAAPAGAQRADVVPPQGDKAQEAADVLANRRRAARAGASAANPTITPGPPVVSATPATPAAPAAAQPAQPLDPRWNDVYQRYMQRSRQ